MDEILNLHGFRLSDYGTHRELILTILDSSELDNPLLWFSPNRMTAGIIILLEGQDADLIPPHLYQKLVDGMLEAYDDWKSFGISDSDQMRQVNLVVSHIANIDGHVWQHLNDVTRSRLILHVATS